MAAALHRVRGRNSGGVSFATANTNLDGSGTLATIITGVAAPGTEIDRCEAYAIGTVTQGAIRVFLYDGTNNRYQGEMPVIGTTPSIGVLGGTRPVVPWSGSMRKLIILPNASFVLKFSTHVAETFIGWAYGGDYV